VSRENVELIRSAVEGYRNPDVLALLASGDLDFELIDVNIEWDASRASELVPDLAGVYWGHEGMRTYWRRWFDAWNDLQFEVQAVLDAGEDVVVLIRNQQQWGRHSGIRTDFPPWAMVFTMRDGKLVRWRAFPDHQSALKAAGLEP
jgi:ketosteroid isomerase-like protein